MSNTNRYGFTIYTDSYENAERLRNVVIELISTIGSLMRTGAALPEWDIDSDVTDYGDQRGGVMANVGKKRQAQLAQVVDQLTQAKDTMAELAVDLRNAFEALPEGLQQTEHNQTKEENSNSLDDMVSEIETIIGDLEGMEL